MKGLGRDGVKGAWLGQGVRQGIGDGIKGLGGFWGRCGEGDQDLGKEGGGVRGVGCV